VIRDEHDGRVPASIEALQALPGVGPYTARAVGAIAFGLPVGAVDVNVERVIGRIAGAGARPPRREVQAVADRIVATTDPATWTHAVMDFGATVCRPRNPRCDACPVRAMCATAATAATGTFSAVDRQRATRPAPPFHATNRWLRGRILDRLRQAPRSAWVPLHTPIGVHELDRVHRAATALAADGMIEIRQREADLQARLTTR
jgi:A/G-specific adenine glycosylase